MKLPIPFLKNKQIESKHYLALLLAPEKIASVILEEAEGKVKIVGKHEEQLTTPLESIEQDALIALVDKIISKAEEVLPPDIETHKTVFGVQESWVDAESKKINKDHLVKLKKVCDSLDLTPIGFMVINEAIANLLQAEEGAPLAAILITLSKNTINLTLFRGGQVAESVSGPIEHQIPVAVDTLLKKFTAPVLPTKIILSASKSAGHLAQQLNAHSWSKSLPFLHIPHVTVLPEDFDAKAVVFGAAHQMGFDVLGLEDLSQPDNSKNHEVNEENKEEEGKELTNDEPPLAQNAPNPQENFGFVADEDIAKNLPVSRNIEKPAAHTAVPHPDKNEFLDEKPIHLNTPVISDNFSHEENIDDSKSSQASKKKNILSSVLAVFPTIPAIQLPKSLKLPEFLTRNKGLRLPLIIAGSILLTGIGITVFYFQGVNAQVVLSVKPKEVTQEASITFSETSGNDFSKNIIAAQSVTANIEGEAVTKTTGKKDTGDKAKGAVTIYNSDNSEATLASGTSIKSSNGLTFTLDKDVKLASASGDIFSGTKPGTAQVSVTAKDIGTESNMPSGTKFTIGGNSSLAAKNDNAFSGGSKKTLTVVSKGDLEKLRKDLPKNLEQKARDEISKKGDNNITVLPTFVDVVLEDPKFDKDVDEEAKEVKLTATVSFKGLAYNNSDLENFDKSILKDSYSQDISFAQGGLKNELKNPEVNEDKEIQADVEITAGLLPKIDNSEVVAKLKNKSPKDAREIISKIPQVVDSEIKYSPNLSFLSSIYNKLPTKTSVLIKTE